jgi:hypothetical protein
LASDTDKEHHFLQILACTYKFKRSSIYNINPWDLEGLFCDPLVSSHTDYQTSMVRNKIHRTGYWAMWVGGVVPKQWLAKPLNLPHQVRVN